MKRARIILSALGVLVVIGTAMAFKSMEAYIGNLRCATFTTTQGAPTIPSSQCQAVTYTTTIKGLGPIRHCTLRNNPTAPCVAQPVTVNL
jgi:hypothetical protein